MNTIREIFESARRDGRGLVLPFFTAGDPDLATTARLLDAAGAVGVEIAEVGIPFSDPIADGPIIAESMHEALVRGVTPSATFETLAARRDPVRPATVAMVSMSIVHRMGVDVFVAAAANARLAGLIVPDIDLTVAADLTARCDAANLACAYLVAPTTTGERLRRVVSHCRGFVYLLARAGVTGESSGLPEIAGQVAAIRAIDPSIPIAAGFGIATPDQVQVALVHADGAIVGSAIVRRIGAERAAQRDPVPAVRDMLASLVAAAKTRGARA